MTTANETSLIEIIKSMDAEYGDMMLLSDGAYDWTPCNLLDALRNADAPDTAEYAVGQTDDGRTTIVRLKDDGFLESIPTFTQKWSLGSLTDEEIEDLVPVAIDEVVAKDRLN